MADWFEPTEVIATPDEIDDAEAASRSIVEESGLNPSTRHRGRPGFRSSGGGMSPGTEAFVKNLPRAAAMGVTQSGAFTMGAGAALTGAGANAMFGDAEAGESMDVVRDAVTEQPQIWSKFKGAAHAVDKKGGGDLLPEWMRQNIAKDKADDYRATPGFKEDKYLGAREAMINAINFGDSTAGGFFNDLSNAQVQFYEGANEATGGRLHYPEDDLALMSPGQRAGLGFTQTAAELFGPSRILQAGIGGAKMAAKAATKAGNKGLMGRAWQGAKNQVNLPNIGMIGGAGIGAAYSGGDEDPDDHAGQVAAAAQAAAFGSLGGLSNAMMARWGVQKMGDAKRGLDKIHLERQEALNKMVVGELYGKEMGEASELVRKTGLEDKVALPFVSDASSSLGASLRKLTERLGPEQQQEYSMGIVKAQEALDEKLYSFKEGLKHEEPPEMVGKLGRRKQSDIDRNTWAVMQHLESRSKTMDRDFDIRYGQLGDEFDKHRIKTIKMSDSADGQKVNVDVRRLMTAMKQARDKIERASVTGTPVEDMMRATQTQRTGAMTTGVAEGTGGIRRFEKGLKEFAKSGKAGKSGVSARALVEFVHNSNEVLKRAEKSGNEAWIKDAQFMKETAYDLLKDAAAQGLLPKNIVDDFIKLQGDRKAFFQLFRGDDEIGRSLRDMSNKTNMQRVEDFQKGFIARSGKISHANILSLYRAVGPNGKSAVNEFLADTIWSRTGRDPKKMFKFYEDNYTLLNDPNYAELRFMTDRLLFENLGIKAGGKDVLKFVSAPDHDQIEHLVRVAGAHGSDTYKYIGDRILDEIATKDVGDRLRFLKNNRDKLHRYFHDGEMRDKLDALQAFSDIERNLGTHTKFKEAVPGNIISATYGKFTNAARKLTGMSAVTLNSMGRAMMRGIVSPTVFVGGIWFPKLTHFWADYVKYKHMMTTFSQHAHRQPDKLLKLMDDMANGKLEKESLQFLRTVGASLAETTYQPARFTQEDIDFYRQMTGDR